MGREAHPGRGRPDRAMAKNSELLDGSDPTPFEVVNGGSAFPVLLVCEHAGRTIPAGLGDLGVDGWVLRSHIAWDIGAATVARGVAAELDAPLVLQLYSRLVIDCNRPVEAVDSIPAASDGIEIPGNVDLSVAEREARINSVFRPFHDAVTDRLDAVPREAVLAIHSFTPVLDGLGRELDIGFLFRKHAATSKRLARALSERRTDIRIRFNEPHTITETSDWFVPEHGERRGLRHSLIEIRNDHLRTQAGCARWASALADSIRALLPGP